MRLVNYTDSSAQRTGLLFQEWLVDLRAASLYLSARSGDPVFSANESLWQPDWFVAADDFSRLLVQRLLAELSACLPERRPELLAEQVLIPPAEVEFLPAVCQPGKIVCVGLNYPEMGASQPVLPPAYPTLFLKPVSALTGHGQPVRLPRASREVLSEGELALVIGRRGMHIPPQQAHSYLAGYTIANDVGARDWERRTSQWTSGKLADTFCPLGPALVTADEIPDPHDLLIRTRLNGEVIQEGSTARMIFNVPSLISYISELTTLEPGDLILTGSPKGIGGLPARWVPMQPGDTVAVEIEGLGALVNPVIAEEA